MGPVGDGDPGDRVHLVPRRDAPALRADRPIPRSDPVDQRHRERPGAVQQDPARVVGVGLGVLGRHVVGVLDEDPPSVVVGEIVAGAVGRGEVARIAHADVVAVQDRDPVAHGLQLAVKDRDVIRPVELDAVDAELVDAQGVHGDVAARVEPDPGGGDILPRVGGQVGDPRGAADPDEPDEGRPFRRGGQEDRLHAVDVEELCHPAPRVIDLQAVTGTEVVQLEVAEDVRIRGRARARGHAVRRGEIPVAADEDGAVIGRRAGGGHRLRARRAQEQRTQHDDGSHPGHAAHAMSRSSRRRRPFRDRQSRGGGATAAPGQQGRQLPRHEFVEQVARPGPVRPGVLRSRNDLVQVQTEIDHGDPPCSFLR